MSHVVYLAITNKKENNNDNSYKTFHCLSPDQQQLSSHYALCSQARKSIMTIFKKKRCVYRIRANKRPLLIKPPREYFI